MLRELRLAVINFPRLERGLDVIDPIPPDEELPDPDQSVDRAWLMEFLDKQEGSREPEFWFGRADQPIPRQGRPSLRDQIRLS